MLVSDRNISHVLNCGNADMEGEPVASRALLARVCALSIFIDLFREYPTTLLGLANGQVLNMVLSVVGLILVIFAFWSRRGRMESTMADAAILEEKAKSTGIGWRQILFVSLLLFSLVIPSDSTQDVPARYGHRHPGLHYSAIYPQIDTSPQK